MADYPGLTFLPGDITGGIGTANREDLLDIIVMISPTSTPFFSSVSKGKAKATLHETPTDELSAAVVDNQVAEAADPTYPALVDRVRVSNYTQIQANPFAVSGSQEAVDKAGVQSEIAYQATKKMKEHARDIESSCFGNTSGGDDGTTGGVRIMKPIIDFIDSGNVEDMGSAILSEAVLNDAMQDAWTEGGEVDTAMMTGTVKRLASTFTTTNTKFLDADERRQINRIEVYEGDFGIVRMLANRWIPIESGTPDLSLVYLFEMSRWTFDFLRRPKEEELAKTGDAMKRQIISEGCVLGKAPKASAAIENVSNTLS